MCSFRERFHFPDLARKSRERKRTEELLNDRWDECCAPFHVDRCARFARVHDVGRGNIYCVQFCFGSNF